MVNCTPVRNCCWQCMCVCFECGCTGLRLSMHWSGLLQLEGTWGITKRFRQWLTQGGPGGAAVLSRMGLYLLPVDRTWMFICVCAPSDTSSFSVFVEASPSLLLALWRLRQTAQCGLRIHAHVQTHSLPALGILILFPYLILSWHVCMCLKVHITVYTVYACMFSVCMLTAVHPVCCVYTA